MGVMTIKRFRTLGGTFCLLTLVGAMTPAPSSAATRHAPTGSITGRFEEVGGPAPGNPRPLSGVVELTSAIGKHVSFDTGKGGSIKGRVAAGTYKVTGRAPRVGTLCPSPVPVVVRAGHGRHFTVTCNVP